MLAYLETFQVLLPNEASIGRTRMARMGPDFGIMAHVILKFRPVMLNGNMMITHHLMRTVFLSDLHSLTIIIAMLN